MYFPPKLHLLDLIKEFTSSVVHKDLVKIVKETILHL